MRVPTDKMKARIRSILNDMPEATVDEPDDWEDNFDSASAFLDKWKTKHDEKRKPSSGPRRPASPTPPPAPKPADDAKQISEDMLKCLTMVLQDLKTVARREQIEEIKTSISSIEDGGFTIEIDSGSKKDIIKAVQDSSRDVINASQNSWSRIAIVAGACLGLGAILSAIVLTAPAIRARLDPVYRCEMAGGHVFTDQSRGPGCVIWYNEQGAR